MDQYRHHVSGFFPNRKDADATLARLVDRQLPPEQLQIYAADAATQPAHESLTKSDGVLQDVLVDGAIGTAVGTGIGALTEIALVAANVSLFIASPLIAPLMFLGWGASLGALVGASAGATAGAGHKHGWFSDLVRDAISNGQVVLLVETRTEQESLLAREIIKDAVGAFKESGGNKHQP